MNGSILLTGATGFVGLNLAVRLLTEYNCNLFLIVRNSKNISADDRISSLFAKYLNEKDYKRLINKVHVINGNITEDNLGLSKSLYEELCRKIQYIFHAAASINFKLSLEESMKINVQGTKNILDFSKLCLKNGQFIKLNHISTAYIAGSEKENFQENQLDIGQKFENSYEISKFESEKMVHHYIDEGLPITIFRPSVIAGNFITGETTKSNLLFGFIKQISNSRYKEFICDEDSSLNIIPVNYFIDAMLSITEYEDSLGKTYHIVNKSNTNIMSLVKTCCEIMGVSLPKFVPLSDREKAPLRVRQLLEVFLPYIEKSHKFDDSLAQKYLKDKNIACPIIDAEFMKRTIEYCVEKNMISMRGECYES